MADNIDVTPGTGVTIGADDIDSVLYQRVKIITGDNNVNDGDVSSSNPMPTEEANSADIKTAVELIDNAIDGTEMQVDVVAPLPAGTNTIGKLAANSGVDIGDVDVLSSALPTGAATEAKQDSAEALLTTIDADTAAMATDLAAIEVLQTTIAGDTTSIDGKITACDTGSIAGTVTANAGTNLNTSALALETGGNLDTISGDTTSINGKITACNTGDVTISASLPTGTNLLGKVGIDQTTDGTTNKVSLSTDVVSVDATGQGDVPITLDGETVAVDLGANNDVTISSGKTIKRAVISASSSGDNTIIAAVADKKIKVLSVLLIAAEATTVRFESGASGDALTGVMSLEAKAGFVIPAPADVSGHWFETGVNTLLNLELGGDVQVSGCITYYEEE
jgi:LEA14-like dessication related protein